MWRRPGIFIRNAPKEMRKKTIISAAVSIMLLATTPTAIYATAQPTECIESACAGQSISEGAETTSASNGVRESELSRKMIQAEKAKNAAENDKYGGAITIIAMSIVLSALIILSVLFLIFGKISSSIQKHRKRQAHGVSIDEAEDHHEELDSGEVIAAISMALAEHEGYGHDMEDTILTIKRMRKAYSPWNSKIYNMRVVQGHSKARHAGE